MIGKVLQQIKVDYVKRTNLREKKREKRRWRSRIAHGNGNSSSSKAISDWGSGDEKSPTRKQQYTLDRGDWGFPRKTVCDQESRRGEEPMTTKGEKGKWLSSQKGELFERITWRMRGSVDEPPDQQCTRLSRGM